MCGGLHKTLISSAFTGKQSWPKQTCLAIYCTFQTLSLFQLSFCSLDAILWFSQRAVKELIIKFHVKTHFILNSNNTVKVGTIVICSCSVQLQNLCNYFSPLNPTQPPTNLTNSTPLCCRLWSSHGLTT